jgi:hypothetical protein
VKKIVFFFKMKEKGPCCAGFKFGNPACIPTLIIAQHSMIDHHQLMCKVWQTRARQLRSRRSARVCTHMHAG